MKQEMNYFLRRKLIFTFLLCCNSIFAQTSSSCTNSDFELGNFSNWSAETGWCCPITTVPSGIIANRHTITTGGIDPYSLGQIPTVFPGGAHSARLGNDHVNSQAEKLKYTFDVTAQTDLFIYRYAVVMQDPGHPPGDQPRFEISVQDQSGQPIGCGTYNVVADSTIPGFQNNGIFRFKTWTTVGIDLSAYIGQTVTIVFATGDCAQGAHFGYAYIDCYCSPLQISSDLCPESEVVNLTAPVGFESYQWSDGQTTSSIAINSPVLGSTYSVTMTSVTGCTVTLSTTVAPTYTHANFIPATTCRNDVGLVDSSYSSNAYPVTSWSWDFGDNQTSSLQNPFHTYQNAGVYNITLIAVNSIGCHDTLVRAVEIMPTPVAQFDASNTCSTALLSLFDQSVIATGIVNQWAWDFGDGSPVETNSDPVHSYEPGIYNITLIATGSNGCTDSISHPVEVYPSPTAAFETNDVCMNSPVVFSDQSISTGDSITSWEWSFGDNTFDASQNPVHYYNLAQQFNVRLVVTSNMGCSDTLQNLITVHPLPNSYFAATGICLNDSTAFTDLSSIAWGTISSREWQFGDASASTDDINPTHLYPATGSYNVSLEITSDFNCQNTFEQPVQIHALPEADFSANSREGCQPLSVHFTDLSNSADGTIQHWYWNFGDSSPLNHTENPNQLYDADGSFSITLTSVSEFGCRDTIKRNAYITVHPKPEAGFSIQPGDPTLLNPAVTLFDAYEGVTGWTYYFGDGYSTSESNPQHFYHSQGDYHIIQIVENQFQCYDTLESLLRIPDDYTFYIPNTFTPNGDGTNDFFYGFGFHVNSYRMNIFDRWGKLVYETNAMEKPWDGKFEGKPVQADIYIYHIVTTDVFNNEHKYVGDVNLVR
jgi:gliding motility-associated-like protein